uniref:Drug resistance transporter YcnB n=1 Tax=uncultured bacterium Contig16 TaxID=1393468 RepID=W0FH33_9BACT|nr:drug resistance transporter YcnB [uncultured bacterium Contig16]
MGEAKISMQKSRLIFVSLLVSSVVASFLSTALNTALPAMVESLGVSVDTGQWITSGFSLAMGIVMPLTAFLITRFRTKGLYLLGLILFVAGSVLCALSNSFIPMMAGRVLQAASNGILVAMTQVVILSIFPREKQGSYMGWYGLAVSAAPMVAPTLGGLLVDALGWRSIFWIVAGVMALSLVFAFFVFDNVLEVKKTSFDLLSFIISVFAFGGITLGAGRLSSRGITDPLTAVSLGVGIAALALFVVKQLKSTEPFLNVRILKYKNYAISVAGSVILYLIMMGGTVLTPLYLQRVVGLRAAVSGLLTLPGSLMSIICSPLAGKLYDRIGMKKLFLIGGMLFLLGNIGMIFPEPLPVLVVSYAVRSAGISFLMMPFVTWGIAGIKDKGATAHGTALLTSLRTIAGAIGTAVFVGIMSSASAGEAAKASGAAGLYGFRMAAIAMSAVALAMVIAGILLIREEK